MHLCHVTLALALTLCNCNCVFALQLYLRLVHAPLDYDTCIHTCTCASRLRLHLHTAAPVGGRLGEWGGKKLGDHLGSQGPIIECQRHLNHLFTSPLNLLVKTNRKDHSEMIRISFYLCNNDKFKDSEGYYKEKLMVAKIGHINNMVEVYGREAPGPPRQTARHPRGSLFYGSPLIRARRTAAPQIRLLLLLSSNSLCHSPCPGPTALIQLYWCIGTLVLWCTGGRSTLWCAGIWCTGSTALKHWCTDALVHWWAEHSLVCRYLVHWFNSLTHWCTDALVH